MATEYERHSRTVEQLCYANVGASVRVIVGLIAMTAIAALIFFTFFDRTPSGSSTTRSDPNFTEPHRTMPKTPVPPPAAAPSTR